MIMEDVEFITALKNNDFIKSIIANNGFSKVNVSQFDCTEEWDNDYTFRNFEIGRWVFDSVNIRLSTGGLFMKFFMAGLAFADELPLILGTGPTYQQAIHPHEPSMMRTKVGKVIIEGEIARISYVISKPYGAQIKIYFVGNLNV